MSDASMVPLTEGATNGAAEPAVKETGKGGQVSINTDALLQAKAQEATAKASPDKKDGQQPDNVPEKKDGQQPSIKPIPPGGHEKFYNKQTGEYNYDAHLREEAFRSEQAAKKAGKKNDDPAKTPDAKPEDEAAKQVAESAGLDWQNLGEKINVLGDIDEEDYAALEKIGVPRDIVSDYILVHKVAAEAVAKEALAYIGGEKSRDELIGWAAKNLSEAEIAKYNSLLNSPNWKLAIDAMKQQYATAGRRGHEPQVRVNGENLGPTSDVYRSFEEQQKDQMDPRYRTDPAFRAKVMEKAARSTYQVRNRI